ncbi:MAG: choice-of-anchor J domain-containing protein, partial [FCB group bacterium]|nr:choice-of-anchor J domain-containing protein [FCB group bacterium]
AAGDVFDYTLSVTVDDPPAPVPQNLMAMAGDAYVDLTWEPVPMVPLSLRYTDSVSPLKTSNPKNNLDPAKILRNETFVRKQAEELASTSNSWNREVGDSCNVATEYGAVNDAAMSGDLVAGGADWYSFTTDGSFQEITVSLCGSTGLSDSKLAIFADCADFTGTLGSYPPGNLAYNDDGCGTGYLSELDLAALEAGTYYAVVYGYSATQAGVYDLNITGVADPCEVFTDTYEPNDIMGDATAAVDGDMLNAALCPTDDSDWFAISGLALGVITAEVIPLNSGAYDTDTYMYFYDAAGVELDTDDDGGAGFASMISYELPADGTYYVEIVVSSWAAGDVFDYTLSVTVDDPPSYIPTWNVYRDGTFLMGDLMMTEYADESVVNGTAYCYTVTQDMEDLSESGLSNEACATPEAAGPGETCESAIVYGAANDPSMAGDLVAGGHDWYSFTTDGSYQQVTISLCNGTGLGDSKLAVFANCDDFVEWPSFGAPEGTIGYNDDACGLLSEVNLAELEAGTYYVAVYGYSATQAGVYDLAITGVMDPCEDFTDVYEPNDLMEAATVAVDGDVMDAALCPTTDSDWYAISGLALGVITAETTPLSFDEYATDTYMYLYGPDGELLDSDDDAGFGYTSLISHELMADGTYYVEVVVSSWAAGDVFDYTLNVTVEAPPLPIPQNLMAMVGFGFIDLSWDPVPTLEVMARSNNGVSALKTSNPKENLHPNKAMLNQIYASKQNEQIALMAGDALREAGDTCAEAIPYGAVGDAAMTGVLPAADHEWYSFTTDGSYQQITVSLCGTVALPDSIGDTKLAVFADCADFVEWPAFGTPTGAIGYNDDGCGGGYHSALDLDVLAAGTYYVAVYGYDADEAGAYELAVTGVADVCDDFVDSYEPNDVMGEATMVVDGDSLGAALCPTTDADWFAVTGVLNSTITVETMPLSLGEYDTDTYMNLYDAAGVLLDSDDDGGFGYTSMITYTLPADGTVYFEVVVSSWAAGDVFDYILDVTVDDPPAYIPTYTLYRDDVMIAEDIEPVDLSFHAVYTDAGLDFGTYCYEVTQNMADMTVSDPSEEACASITPMPPMNLMGMAADAVVELSWDPPLVVETGWLGYHDGTFENSLASTEGGAGIATLFQPLLYPVTVDSVRFHISGTGWELEAEVYILADDGATVLDGPYNMNGVEDDWITIDNVDITLESGGFMLATYNVGAGGPYVSVDMDHYMGNVYFGHHSSGFSELGSLGFEAVASHEAYVNYDGNAALLSASVFDNETPGSLGTPVKTQTFAATNPEHKVLHTNRTRYLGNQDNNASRELTGYNVYRGIDPEDLTLLGTATETFYADLTVENGMTYFYMVTAGYDPEGESLPTNMVAFTPLGSVGIPYFSDFEADNGGFSPSGDWQWGAPDFVDGPDTAFSVTNLWGTVLDGDHPVYSDSKLVLPFDLSTAGGTADLSYAVWFDLEINYDYGYVGIDHDNDGDYDILAEYNGNSGGWIEETLTIPASHLTSYAKIAFIMISDVSINNAGLYIDNVSVQNTPSGILNGVVTSTYNNAVLPEALVLAIETTTLAEYGILTGPDGSYMMYLPVGTYEVGFGHPDYFLSELTQVVIPLDGTVTLDAALAPNVSAPSNLMAQETDGGVQLSWDLFSGNEGEEGFESGGIPLDWTTIDLDGDGYNWMAVEGFAHTGDFSVTSESYRNGIGPLTPNNFLITPQFEISDGTTLSFWVGAVDASWYFEHFDLMLSIAGTNPEDFTVELLDYTLGTDVWTEVVVDLSAYAGFSAYVAWVHNDITDVYSFNIDDISVVGGDGLALVSNTFDSPEDIERFQIAPFRITEDMTEEEIQVRLDEFENADAASSLRSELLFFKVYSNVGGAGWNMIGAAADGLAYFDDTAIAGQSIEYKVTAQYDIAESDYSNTVQLQIVGVDELGVPNTFALHQNYPNPFNPITSIRYDLPEAAFVRIVVYNVLGQKVATLVDQSMNAGYHDITWSGTNDLGSSVSSGIYLYRIESENFNAVRKLMYLK